jgi:ATP-dependent Clp protease ATP-binding subunit ClpX
MTDAMFEIPSSEEKVEQFTITLDYAKKKLDKSGMNMLRVA